MDAFVKRVRPSSRALLSHLDALLVTERMALLSGRDDEFVWEILKRWTGMRSGEIHGLETRYLINTGHPHRQLMQVEWQLTEVKSKPVRIAPKDESYRNIDIPLFLWDLLTGQVARTRPQPCPCHGYRYVFTGNVRRRAVGNPKGATQAAVAKRAGVSERAVKVAFAGGDGLSEETRARVLAAADEIGYRLEAARIPRVLIDERLGHEDGSVQANYTHITDDMRDELVEMLTARWFEALDARLAMCPTSPVRVLNELLQARARNRSPLVAA
ncbi:helix-turn-helix domain-containing protein [Nocardia sp. BMG51109]|uniref:helix-turn-helix domain-containing protein n=1 Tax=Nocardia sp. BMG51109 TaxID=1056816 RepID=UPI0004BCED48|nr:helix-turn-helix domain-containing protein [Nocardia sp. BMG51109]